MEFTTASTLSNNILDRARRDKISVTPMKLQKLLYYVCVEYVKKTGRLPITENFQVWRYGPVVMSVYSEFKPFGSSPITNYALNAAGKATIVDEDYSPILKGCLDSVWDKLKTFSGIDLSKRTHLKGSGWYTAYQQNRTSITTEDMMHDTTI